MHSGSSYFYIVYISLKRTIQIYTHFIMLRTPTLQTWKIFLIFKLHKFYLLKVLLQELTVVRITFVAIKYFVLACELHSF